jgi:hypothetical protein
MNFAEIAALPGGTACLTPHYALRVTGGTAMDCLLGGRPSTPAGDRLVLVVSALWGHSSFRFTSPKAATRWQVLEFKHYRSGGSKFWTSSAGKTHYLAVPLAAIELQVPPADDRCGWGSYPKVTIGGQTLTLSVSGGSGGPDGRWLDFVGTVASTRCNLPRRTLAAIEALASPERPELQPDNDRDAYQTWKRLRRCVAERLGPAALQVGHRVSLATGYRWTDTSEEAREVSEVNRRRRRCTVGAPYSFDVPFSRIDWLRFCELNQVPFPADFPVEPAKAVVGSTANESLGQPRSADNASNETSNDPAPTP